MLAYINMNIDQLMQNIGSVLSSDLLTPKYARLERRSPTEGHCYAAAEALYHILGGKQNGYTPCVASFVENEQTFTHWWIRDREGKIWDPTQSQFTSIGQSVPYHLGRGAGFLTGLPSKRAVIIINRLRQKNLIEFEFEHILAHRNCKLLNSITGLGNQNSIQVTSENTNKASGRKKFIR